jgi:hypothetical protein
VVEECEFILKEISTDTLSANPFLKPSVHCLFCDAYENRGGHIGLLGLQSQDLEPMLMALRLTKDKVTVFTNGGGVATDEAGQMGFEIATALGVSNLTTDHSNQSLRILTRSCCVKKITIEHLPTSSKRYTNTVKWKTLYYHLVGYKNIQNHSAIPATKRAPSSMPRQLQLPSRLTNGSTEDKERTDHSVVS